MTDQDIQDLRELLTHVLDEIDNRFSELDTQIADLSMRIWDLKHQSYTPTYPSNPSYGTGGSPVPPVWTISWTSQVLEPLFEKKQ
jgi:hypothetical protein